MGGSPQTLTKELLHDLCVVQKIPARQVAIQLGVGRHRVYRACKRHGIRLSPGNWKGGRIKDKQGYVLLHRPGHPHARKGYVREHRLVMEQAIGRYLLPEEAVHHKNDIRDDNRIENLELFANNGHHLSVTTKEKPHKWTPEGRAKSLSVAKAKRGIEISREELAELYSQHSAKTIAKMKGVSPDVIQSAMRRHGIKARRGGQQANSRWPDNQTLHELLKTMTIAEIAEKYDGTADQLRWSIYQRGMTIRKLQQLELDS